MRSLLLAAVAGAFSAGVGSGATQVVGGSTIRIQAAPWTVFVQQQSGLTTFLCTGSVVDASHILTAAHCVYNDAGALAAPAALGIRAGVSNLSSPLKTDAEQDRPVSAIRVHPSYVWTGRPAPDDVAVLALATPLDLSGPAVQAIPLPTAGTAFPSGAAVAVAGFGRESPTVSSSGQLARMTGTVDAQGTCGSTEDGMLANNGILVCASSSTGAVCNGDSGSGLVTVGATPTLIGVVSDGTSNCDSGTHGVFTYIGAPEILDFVQGNDDPPLAPRATETTTLDLKWNPPLVVGSTVSCATGGWSGDRSRFTYAFVNLATGRVLQAGPKSTYPIPLTAAGATIACEVTAVNDGGTTLAETKPTSAVGPAPMARILRIRPLAAARGQGIEMRVTVDAPRGLWGKVSVCLAPPKTVAGRLCRSTVNSDGAARDVPFIFDFRVKPGAPLGTSPITITATAGVSKATASAPLRVTKS